MRLKPAPALQVAQWLNAAEPLSLDRLRGRIAVIEAFQMLCPGCVSHGLPQAARVREPFREEDVAVIGLHSVFEHTQAQTPAALAVALPQQHRRRRRPVGHDVNEHSPSEHTPSRPASPLHGHNAAKNIRHDILTMPAL